MSTTTLPNVTPAEVLAERVYHALAAEEGCPLAAAGDIPVIPEPGALTSFELDCRDWGIAYGLAHGIARGEDPFETNTSVAERALEAAKIAWARWGDSAIFTEEAFRKSRAGDRPKSMHDALKPLLDVYEGLYGPVGQKPDLPQELMDALDKLALETS